MRSLLTEHRFVVTTGAAAEAGREQRGQCALALLQQRGSLGWGCGRWQRWWQGPCTDRVGGREHQQRTQAPLPEGQWREERAVRAQASPLGAGVVDRERAAAGPLLSSMQALQGERVPRLPRSADARQSQVHCAACALR